MKFQRIFAMPSHDTLSVPEMRDFARQFMMAGERSVDPFARNCRLATVTNDINPETAAQYHMDAVEFCDMLHSQGDSFDVGIFDPPYSPRQITECYQGIGLKCSMEDTQAAFWRKAKDALDRIIKPGGIVVCYGWNSGGMGLTRGYALEAVLIVNHGGAHNDTICTAERKAAAAQDLFMEAAA